MYTLYTGRKYGTMEFRRKCGTIACRTTETSQPATTGFRYNMEHGHPFHSLEKMDPVTACGCAVSGVEPTALGNT